MSSTTDPAPATTLDRVRELLPRIAELAVTTDESRRVPPETIEALRSAGVFRMLQPTRYGGREGDPLEFFEVVRSVAAVCPSTGWVASVVGVHPWQISLFEERAQDDVWGAGPDVVVSSAYAPVGRLKRGPGGLRLSGRWSFSSGCDYAEWALLGAMMLDDAGKPIDFVTVLVPRAEYTVHDVWDTVGLRGTGSNDIVVEDVLVPEHRVLSNYEHAHLRGPGQQVNPGPLYRMPFGAMFTAAVTMPLLGAVTGCLDAYLARMRERVRLSLGGGRFVEDQFAQVTVARAASEVDAAILQMERNLRELRSRAEEGVELPMELRLRTRRDQVRATERAVVAVDLLFRGAGGSSLHRANPVARAWRDVHAGSVHVANDPERALALYGRGAFGLTVQDSLV